MNNIDTFNRSIDIILEEIIAVIADSFGEKDNPYTIELPEDFTVDLPLEELASYVARTANAYGRATRASGIARAKAKRAKGHYDSKYKRSKIGKNETEREQNAMIACQDLQTEYINAESVAEVLEGIENGARVCSESARKLYDKALNQQQAARRESHGAYQEGDFR